MEWIRSMDPFAAARHEPHREPDVDADAATPKFVLVDSKNRVRELTAAPAMAAADAPSPMFAMPLSRPVAMAHSHHHSHHHHHHHHSNSSRPFADNDAQRMEQDDNTNANDEDAQLAQQLQFQREEMQFTRSQHATLPRLTPPPSHPFPSQHQQLTPALGHQHAFTYSDSTYTPSHAAAPPVSPFAGLALSAPAKSNTMNARPPVNPFATAGLAASIESSPRLPSLTAFRAGSPRNLRLGIASRPPLSASTSTMPSPLLGPVSNNNSSNISSVALPSLSSSLPSPHHHSFAYSQSLPGLSFLRPPPTTTAEDAAASDSPTNSDEDDERDSALLMMRLSASVPSSTTLLDAAGRSGRVCRYSDCSNIARSRGLCRTHGGGKRCSHAGCNKSAQANRKCIAHGGGTPCSFEDCEKTAQSRGLCKAHGGGARCKHPNCPKSSQSKGLCRGHGGGIKCKEDDCDKWVQKNGYCIKHGRERAMSQ